MGWRYATKEAYDEAKRLRGRDRYHRERQELAPIVDREAISRQRRAVEMRKREQLKREIAQLLGSA